MKYSVSVVLFRFNFVVLIIILICFLVVVLQALSQLWSSHNKCEVGDDDKETSRVGGSKS